MSSNGHYVGPVLLASDVEKANKLRVITINKNTVFKDIDLYTHKHVDAREELGPRSGNAISSDATEAVDATVLARYVEMRNSQLRMVLQFALEDVTAESADDEIKMQEPVYVYRFIVPDNFNDNTLRPIAEYIHRFLVFGALYDWYAQFGMSQAAVYEKAVDGLEEKIISALRGPSIVKRPMQPFGPAEKIY